MPIVKASASPRFEIPFLNVTGLAAPSRGSRETCVWRLSLAAGAPGTVHTVDREEIFVALAGRARVDLDGHSHDLVPGDTLIVPAGQAFALENPGPEAFEALAVLPVGGQACLPAGEPFSPPWTE